MIEDLNSTNGIFIKSKRVRHHNLNDGDVVTIGQHELLYVDERTPRSADCDWHSMPAAEPARREAEEARRRTRMPRCRRRWFRKARRTAPTGV